MKSPLRIVSRADESQFFHLYVIPAKSSRKMLQLVKKSTRVLEAKVAAEENFSAKELVQKVFEKTQKEVETGVMSAALMKASI